MKKISALLITVLLSLSFSTLLLAESQDDVDGSFEAVGHNNPAELRSFQIYNDDEPLAVSELTPQKEYRIVMEIYDEDTIADIKQIEIVFYHTESGESPRALSTLLDEGTGLTGEEMVMTWTRDISSADNEDPDAYNPTAPADFSLQFKSGIDSSKSTWKITNSTTPAILAAGQTTPAAFTFEVAFEVSKVAAMSTEGEWQWGVQITDGAVPNYSDLYTLSSAAIKVGTEGIMTSGPSQYRMQFYGEIEIPSGAAIVWRGVEPGMTYTHPNALATLEDVLYIANGEYVHENSVNAFWVISGAAADGTTQAALTADTFDAPQQFAIKAGMNVADLSEPEDGIQMIPGPDNDTLAYAPIVLRDRAHEDGHYYDFYYWLSLSEDFQNAEYSGLLTAKVNNSVAVSGTSVVSFTEYATNSSIVASGAQSNPPSNSSSSSPSNSGGVNTLTDNPPPNGKTGIYTWKDLWNIRENIYIDGQWFGPGEDYIVMNHLNADTPGYDSYGSKFEAISYPSGGEFNGSLDGNGYLIEDLVIINPNTSGVQSLALFSYLDRGAVLENLVISGVSIEGTLDNAGSSTTRYDVAVLASTMNKATLRNITLSNITIDVDLPVEIRYVAGAVANLYVDGSSATIENLTLENASITCDGDCPSVGGLFGRVYSDISLSNLTLSQLNIHDVTVAESGDSSNQVGLIYGALRENSPFNVTSNQNLEDYINNNTTTSGTNSP